MSEAMVLDLRLGIDSKGLDRLVAAMSGPDRAKAMFGVSEAMRRKTVSHLVSIAARRHGTAQRLGASPTNYLASAARLSYNSHTEDTATVEIPKAGLRRAFRPLTIRPKTAKALAIPLNAISYGVRAADMRDNPGRYGFSGTFVIPNTGLIAGKKKGGNDITVLYALAMQAMIPQDRELLPSDQEYADTAKSAYVRAIKAMRTA